jgi:hypothetical protein
MIQTFFSLTLKLANLIQGAYPLALLPLRARTLMYDENKLIPYLLESGTFENDSQVKVSRMLTHVKNASSLVSIFYMFP